MARALALLVALAALAATASASTAQVSELAVSHNDIQLMVEQIASELETEVYSAMAEAHRRHAEAQSLQDVFECIEHDFDEVIAAASRVLDIIQDLRDLANDLLNKLGKCEGNVLTSLPCRISLITGAFKKAVALKEKAKALISKIREAAADFVQCIHPSSSSAAPGTDGTTSAAPEGTTGAPEGTTAAPAGTTAAPEGSTAAPEGTTAAPEGTTAGPVRRRLFHRRTNRLIRLH